MTPALRAGTIAAVCAAFTVYAWGPLSTLVELIGRNAPAAIAVDVLALVLVLGCTLRARARAVRAHPTSAVREKGPTDAHRS